MGDAALLVELGDAIDQALNARAHDLAQRLAAAPGIIEIVPAYAALLIEFDPARISCAALENHVAENLATPCARATVQPRVVEIPTRYGGEFGPDLEFVAQYNHISPKEVIRLHTSQPLRVFMLGFAPGFPYLGILPPSIAAPRLDTPRAKVPAGSVGIAGQQTGIYPRASPGGWRLIGCTDVKLFDPTQDPPTLLRPGDFVRFVRVDR